MQIYVPYSSPMEVAKCLDRRRLHSQIREAYLVLDSLDGKKKWRGVLVEMYRPYQSWLQYYKDVLECYRDGKEYEGIHIDHPPFLTEEFCEHHRRRLFSHAPDKYSQFAYLGYSEENWYFDNLSNTVIKYANGKRL